jgi:hypothetical protein
LSEEKSGSEMGEERSEVLPLEPPVQRIHHEHRAAVPGIAKEVQKLQKKISFVPYW